MKGTIKVTIGLHQMKDPVTEQSGPRMFEFKVEDTGKGISSDYLKTKLYTRKSLQLSSLTLPLIYHSILSGRCSCKWYRFRSIYRPFNSQYA